MAGKFGVSIQKWWERILFVPLSIFWFIIWLVKLFRAGPATEVLLRQLTSSDSNLRLQAVTYLRKRRGLKITAALLACLKDNDNWVRHEAAIALGMSQNKQAFEPLLAALAIEQSPVLQGVIVGLGHLKDKRAIPSLLPFLQDTDPNIRTATATALQQLGYVQKE